jgi:hypothetical protein
MIKKELQPAGWLIASLETSPETGIQLRNPAANVEEYISQKKHTGTLTANELRTVLEKLLKEIAFALEVKFAFRYNDQNERRMPGELLSELRAKLNKRSPEVVKSSAFSQLGVSTLVTTVGSHDSGPVVSPGDIDTTADDILNFNHEFWCKDCGHYVAIERFVQHEERVYCKCGKKHLDWKE